MTRFDRQDLSDSSEKTETFYSSSVSDDSSVTMVLDSNDTLRFSGNWIKDSSDRTLLFRGINLSGASKNPASPPIPSHQPEGFFDHRNVNFVGRPFHLDEADQHFVRLRQWGFNFLRFIVTWEALEHSGPGIYDHEFIDFTIKVLIKARDYGFRCFIDPHQDVWSRFSGGSGAPGWTLDLVGFNMRNFTATDAAIVHNTYENPEKFPKMEYLQSHFCNAYKLLAEKICEAQLHDSTVIGFDTMNEPSWGFVGAKDLNKIPEFQEYRRGRIPTPFQAMLLGEGIPCTLEVWDIVWYGFGVVGKERIDPNGKTAWLKDDPEGYPWEKGPEFPKGCIWAGHGIWDKKTKELLRPDYFAINPDTGREPDWNEDCLKPFVQRYARTIRSVYSNAIIFVQPPVLEQPPRFDKSDELNERLVYSPHWYDGVTLVQKRYNWWTIDYLGIKRGKYRGFLPAIKVGDRAIKRNFADQLELIKNEREFLGDVPCIIGEIGIPYDMQDKKAYKDGDYSQQIKAMEASIQALEANLLSFTLWNYCPDNNHEWGDQWNGEDLSIYSLSIHGEKIHSMMSSGSDQGSDVGGRALESLLRPFPIKTNGQPLSLKFNPYKKHFEYVFKNPVNPSADSPTEIYLPRHHFSESEDFSIYHSSGKWKWDKASQLLLYWHDVGDPEDNEEENHLVHRIIVESNRRNYEESGWNDCC
ncbi:3440_t:CDS:2 [Acaulospora colombiana]|uniref:3440_t:CDS:1 n=1 Tax=Acaulospora colombiana TaxID=27376 RepID=A0ACA9KHR9_9GLOM|nr:3440_t:CDS:2 [Acaulospora colombiana]